MLEDLHCYFFFSAKISISFATLGFTLLSLTGFRGTIFFFMVNLKSYSFSANVLQIICIDDYLDSHKVEPGAVCPLYSAPWLAGLWAKGVPATRYEAQRCL